jgi:hypothetical protein
MRRFATTAVGVCFMALAAAGARAGSGPDDDFAAARPRVGEQAPGFSLHTADGGTVRLSDACRRGPVVLVFGSFS